MSSLNEVYGDNFQSEAIEMRCKQLIELITNNLSHREFVFHLDNCEIIWKDNHIIDSYVKQICQRVNQKNTSLKVRKIDLDRLDNRSLLPYLIESDRVEYFYIVDCEFNRYYLIFITPSMMGSF